jgi:hypothetical protein
LPSQKHRHFGRDAEIQAMDGNVPVLQLHDLYGLPARNFTSLDTQTLVVTHSLPSLDAGFRHPCQNDGFFAFVLANAACLSLMRAAHWSNSAVVCIS